MELKRLVILLVLSAFILMLTPVALAAGSTINGRIAFPANTTLGIDINQTVNVSKLTIYAIDMNTGFVNTTNPNADGTYSIPLPENGRYRLWVFPGEVIDSTDYAHLKVVQYPDMGSRVYLIDVTGTMNNVDISYFAPGKYTPPNELTLGSPTPSATVTPKPSSGFAIVLALAGLIAAFALVGRRK